MKLPGRKAKRARPGEYVLASKFSDCDPCDPWRVGFVCEVTEVWKPQAGQKRFYYVIGDAEGKPAEARRYSYCRRITAEEGDKWLSLYGTDKEK